MVHIDGAEPLQGLDQAFAERDLWLPVQLAAGQGDIGLALRRIVGRQRPVDEFGLRAGQFDHQLRQLQDRELAGVAEVHRARKIVRTVHHPDDAFHQVVPVAEAARLRAVAKDRDVFSVQCLANEVAHHAAVEGMHPRAVGVEDPHDADVQSVHAMIVHE